MRLYLVRHAQTAWNMLQTAQGHSDQELNAAGFAQAHALAASYADAPIRRIVSSDLKRCMQTVEPLAKALNLEPEPMAILRERSFGDWEGYTYSEVRSLTEAIDPIRENVRPPNGESTVDVWNRIQPIAEALRKGDENTLVMSHGGTTALLLAQLIHGSVMTARSFRFENTAVTILERRPDGDFHLAQYADTSHLEGISSGQAFGVVG